MGFQTKVNLNPAEGWHGDFASTNPKVSVIGTKGGFQVGMDGVKIGSFVWINADGITVGNKGTGSPIGFVGREMTGIITQYLQEGSMVLPAGFMVTIYAKAEFLIELPVSIASVSYGDTIYVSSQTGDPVPSTDSNAVETAYKYARNGQGGDIVMISAWI